MSPSETRMWIKSRLDPIESYDPATRKVTSDAELNPDFPRYTKPLSPAAVLVPLVEHEAGMTVLLTRRSDNLRNHTGQVAFPGGRCEPGETPWEAAIREAWEEVGLDAAHVEIAGLSTALQTGAGFDITPVVAFVRPGFELKPNPDEVADVFEAPFSFLMDPASYELRSMVVASGATRHFYAAPYEEQLIWGATAIMLRKLYERLYGPPAE